MRKPTFYVLAAMATVIGLPVAAARKLLGLLKRRS